MEALILYCWQLLFGPQSSQVFSSPCLPVSASAYQAFVPWAAGNDCLLTNELSYVIRQRNIYSCAWLLFVAKGKTHLPNMFVLVAVLIISSVFGTFFDTSVKAEECKNTWMAQWWWWIGWPLLAIIFAYVERRVDGTTTSGTGAENQQLV